MASAAEPIPFIVGEDDGKFSVNQAAVDVLHSLGGAKVALVAVAGPWRTGKSFLLNQLLDSGKPRGKDAVPGFQVGGTVNACTRGIWVWGEPIELEDGTKVLLVDTEGLCSVKQSAHADVSIFALSLLLSSFFVWNSRGVIDGAALEMMAVVVSLTKHLHVRSSNKNGPAAATAATGGGGGGGPARQASFSTLEEMEDGAQSEAALAPSTADALADYFPGFLWVVRDFTLQLEAGGRKFSERQYLEKALKPQAGMGEEVDKRNRIRTLLSSFFRERDCVTLVRPCEDEAKLRRLSSLPREELRQPFLDGIETVRRKVFQQCRPKVLKGRQLTGRQIATLAQAYVAAINSGTGPVISDAWTRVVEGQADRAMQDAVRHYRQQMSEGLGFSYLQGRASGGGGGRGAGGKGWSDLRFKVDLSPAASPGLPVSTPALLQAHDAALAAAVAKCVSEAWGDAAPDLARRLGKQVVMEQLSLVLEANEGAALEACRKQQREGRGEGEGGEEEGGKKTKNKNKNKKKQQGLSAQQLQKKGGGEGEEGATGGGGDDPEEEALRLMLNGGGGGQESDGVSAGRGPVEWEVWTEGFKADMQRRADVLGRATTWHRHEHKRLMDALQQQKTELELSESAFDSLTASAADEIEAHKQARQAGLSATKAEAAGVVARCALLATTKNQWEDVTAVTEKAVKRVQETTGTQGTQLLNKLVEMKVTCTKAVVKGSLLGDGSGGAEQPDEDDEEHKDERKVGGRGGGGGGGDANVAKGKGGKGRVNALVAAANTRTLRKEVNMLQQELANTLTELERSLSVLQMDDTIEEQRMQATKEAEELLKLVEVLVEEVEMEKGYVPQGAVRDHLEKLPLLDGIKSIPVPQANRRPGLRISSRDIVLPPSLEGGGGSGGIAYAFSPTSRQSQQAHPTAGAPPRDAQQGSSLGAQHPGSGSGSGSGAGAGAGAGAASRARAREQGDCVVGGDGDGVSSSVLPWVSTALSRMGALVACTLLSRWAMGALVRSASADGVLSLLKMSRVVVGGGKKKRGKDSGSLGAASRGVVTLAALELPLLQACLLCLGGGLVALLLTAHSAGSGVGAAAAAPGGGSARRRRRRRVGMLSLSGVRALLPLALLYGTALASASFCAMNDNLDPALSMLLGAVPLVPRAAFNKRGTPLVTCVFLLLAFFTLFSDAEIQGVMSGALGLKEDDLWLVWAQMQRVARTAMAAVTAAASSTVSPTATEEVDGEDVDATAASAAAAAASLAAAGRVLARLAPIAATCLLSAFLLRATRLYDGSARGVGGVGSRHLSATPDLARSMGAIAILAALLLVPFVWVVEGGVIGRYGPTLLNWSAESWERGDYSGALWSVAKAELSQNALPLVVWGYALIHLATVLVGCGHSPSVGGME